MMDCSNEGWKAFTCNMRVVRQKEFSVKIKRICTIHRGFLFDRFASLVTFEVHEHTLFPLSAPYVFREAEKGQRWFQQMKQIKMRSTEKDKMQGSARYKIPLLKKCSTDNIWTASTWHYKLLVLLTTIDNLARWPVVWPTVGWSRIGRAILLLSAPPGGIINITTGTY